MISAWEACKRSRNKLSPAAKEQMNEIEKEILIWVNRCEDPDFDPDGKRMYCYYDKPILAEVKVALAKLGYKIETDNMWYHEWCPDSKTKCISWYDAAPSKYRGPKIT